MTSVLVGASVLVFVCVAVTMGKLNSVDVGTDGSTVGNGETINEHPATRITPKQTIDKIPRMLIEFREADFITRLL
jgi:hypothetical protein